MCCCSRHAKAKELALSAFGFRELARSRFLRFFYLDEVCRLDLVQLIILEIWICLVPRLRFKVFLQFDIFEYASVPGVDLVSKYPEIFGK